ncbi:MAG: ABC transporter permease [Deltaproteobacteria bacterium]|jgi:peptide/nickel transport system permease protein|nr:ABC transporter permease [Deltaproteobacteria bacterium]MBW1747781.1 ABC transporter permease [Deltaproteobacteria bacterium]MBW1825845.1 ABC transporter permease [Deltaproteobacteria bacterium]MBW1968607.1 ABC transporter permease [Deltaproteobacteria bacterium]MBW2155944.1 ABC transporter permease [Deltaproteobacteria bacterium]
MLSFIGRSFVQKIITLFFVSIVSFLIIHLAPGKPSQVDPMNPKFTPEVVERFRKEFHLDKPLYVQYVYFYQDLFTGKTVSWKDNQSVLKKIWERFLNSLPLFIVGTLLTWTLSFPVGIRSAIFRKGIFDRTATFLSYLLISIPGFFFAYVLIIFVVTRFHVPVIGMVTFGIGDASIPYILMDRIWHMLLPSVLVATGGIAVLSRYVRSQMLEVEGQDYIRTARAKGLPPEQVHYKHALRNALLPFVTMFGLILPGLIGGSVIIESIFSWPGMGRMAYEAILARDYPIILTVNFVSAVLVLAGTFISDLLYLIVDPRIRL